MTITINATNTTDITEAYSHRVPSLDLTGFTILDRPGSERYVWAYLITNGEGFILSGTTDDLRGAVQRAATTARALRNEGTTPTVLIGHHTF